MVLDRWPGVDYLYRGIYFRLVEIDIPLVAWNLKQRLAKMDELVYTPMGKDEGPLLATMQDQPEVPRVIYSELWGCYWADGGELRAWRATETEGDAR